MEARDFNLEANVEVRDFNLQANVEARDFNLVANVFAWLKVIVKRNMQICLVFPPAKCTLNTVVKIVFVFTSF